MGVFDNGFGFRADTVHRRVYCTFFVFYLKNLQTSPKYPFLVAFFLPPPTSSSLQPLSASLFGNQLTQFILFFALRQKISFPFQLFLAPTFLSTKQRSAQREIWKPTSSCYALLSCSCSSSNGFSTNLTAKSSHLAQLASQSLALSFN